MNEEKWSKNLSHPQLGKILHSPNMWEDIFCYKQTPLVFMNRSQFGLMTGWWWWLLHVFKAGEQSIRRVNSCCGWIIWLKWLFIPALYIYWDTWKTVVINQATFHIPHFTTWLWSVFGFSFSFFVFLPLLPHAGFYLSLCHTKLQMLYL